MKKTVQEAIKGCMEERAITQQKLAEKANMKTAQEIHSLLRAKNGIRSHKLRDLLDAMGYDLVIRDRVNDTEVVLGK